MGQRLITDTLALRVARLCANRDSRGQSRQPPSLGRLLLVNAGTGPAHRLFPGLDARLGAALAEDVAQVAWLWEGHEVVGRYTDGAPGYQVRYRVLVFDLGTGQPLASQVFACGSPPATKRGGGARTGSAPDQDLRQWLEGLPAKR